MKVIVAGSRSIMEYALVKDAIEIFLSSSTIKEPITEIVSGNARGVDRLGEKYAQNHNIHIERFIPDWNYFGKSAGYIRNKEMVDYADALIAIWDGKSKGTLHTINLSDKKGIPALIYEITDNNYINIYFLHSKDKQS